MVKCDMATEQRMVTLSLPDDVYRRAEHVAFVAQREVAAVLLDTITAAFTSYPQNAERVAMKAEIAAYEAMHADLVKTYLGQYVAICHGKLIDHDVDPVVLHQRITQKYPGKTVLSRKVQQDAAPVLHMRSPRIERQP